METDMKTEEEKLEINSAQETLRVLESRLPEVWWLWKTTFDQPTFLRLLNDLPSCIDQFMEEIIAETTNYAQRQAARVDELQIEMKDLTTLLGGVSYVLDPSALASLPVECQLRVLEAKVDALRKEVAKRKTALEIYTLRQRELCLELGRPEIDLNPSGRPLPTDRQFLAIHSYIDRLVKVMNFRHGYISVMWLHCNILAITLKWPLRDKQELLQRQCVAPTQDNLNELQQLRCVLGTLFESATRNKKPLAALREPGKAIALRPFVVERYRIAGECTRNSPNGPGNEQHLAGGWARLEQLWDRCLISPYERRLFRQSVKNWDPDALLAAQTDMERVLLNYYNGNAKMFMLFFMWADLWNLLLNVQRLRAASTNASRRPRDPSLVVHLDDLNVEINTMECRLKDFYEKFEQHFCQQFIINGLPIQSVIEMCKERKLKFELPDNWWFEVEDTEDLKFHPREDEEDKENSPVGTKQQPQVPTTPPTVPPVSSSSNAGAAASENTPEMVI
ncbi:uncharacterized protein LOC131216424 [Anopheles bellator]|uniref:uncharacterized protein LOC131216424 n=1 Tax=Anopheles bellator TaxID=139047 RepID=UPI0026470D6F|nr:uncharacterized protein LOC131216424 [Anopheles bellator]